MRQRTPLWSLVVTCENHTLFRGFACHHANSGSVVAVKWNAADGRFCLLLDLCLGFGRAVPVGKDKDAFLDSFLEFIVCIDLDCAALAVFKSTVVKILLDIVENFLDLGGDSFEGKRFLLESVTTHKLDSAILKVALTDCKAHGDTLDLIVGKLESGTLVVGIVIFNAYAE